MREKYDSTVNSRPKYVSELAAYHEGATTKASAWESFERKE